MMPSQIIISSQIKFNLQLIIYNHYNHQFELSEYYVEVSSHCEDGLLFGVMLFFLRYSSSRRS